VDICCNVRLACGSLSTICDNAGRTEESTRSGTKVTTRRNSFSRSSKMEHMAEMLSIWIEDQKQCHMPVSAFG
jgi:hypothetical protein